MPHHLCSLVTCFPCHLFFPIACLSLLLVFSYSLLLIHHSYVFYPSCQHVHLGDVSAHLVIYLAFCSIYLLYTHLNLVVDNIWIW